MDKNVVIVAGANRGGTCFSESALKHSPQLESVKQVAVLDPKADRAERLARVWEASGIPAKGIKERCEDAVDRINSGPLFLSIDELTPMVAVLEKSPLSAQWQLLARGPGESGPVVGMSGTVGDGDVESQAASVKLIKELGEFIPPQSSSSIRENALNADGLQVIRRRVSEHSVRRLQVLDREPQDIRGGVLNLFWGANAFPMMARERPENIKWRETLRMAVETELPVSFENNPAFAVAVVGRRNVDFFFVEEARGKRMVRFHLPLVHMLPVPIPATTRAVRRQDTIKTVIRGIDETLVTAAITD